MLTVPRSTHLYNAVCCVIDGLAWPSISDTIGIGAPRTFAGKDQNQDVGNYQSFIPTTE